MKYSVRTLSILAMRILHFSYYKTLYDCSSSISQLNWIFGCEIYFSNWWEHLNVILWRVRLLEIKSVLCLLLKSVIMENSKYCMDYFLFFTILKPNEIKSSLNIMQFHGYFFIIALGTRLIISQTHLEVIIR